MIINQIHQKTDFDQCIKTEELIFSQLIQRAEFISDEFELFPYPLAVFINQNGISWTNNFISNCSSDKRRVFVCQHIWAEHLHFKDSDAVFTPHATKLNKFNSIPHQSVNFDIGQRRVEKTVDFSFVGNLGAHQVRKNLASLYPDKVKDSGVGWGLDLSTPIKAKLNYTKLLGESHFSLCPRGTGISSVRLFESLATGSIPIIIADNYSPPLNNFLDWNDFSISVPEDCISEIPKLVGELTKNKAKLKKMREIGIEVYDSYFSNENLYKTVEIILANNVSKV